MSTPTEHEGAKAVLDVDRLLLLALTLAVPATLSAAVIGGQGVDATRVGAAASLCLALGAGPAVGELMEAAPRRVVRVALPLLVVGVVAFFAVRPDRQGADGGLVPVLAVVAALVLGARAMDALAKRAAVPLDKVVRSGGPSVALCAAVSATSTPGAVSPTFAVALTALVLAWLALALRAQGLASAPTRSPER